MNLNHIGICCNMAFIGTGVRESRANMGFANSPGVIWLEHIMDMLDVSVLSGELRKHCIAVHSLKHSGGA